MAGPFPVSAQIIQAAIAGVQQNIGALQATMTAHQNAVVALQNQIAQATTNLNDLQGALVIVISGV